MIFLHTLHYAYAHRTPSPDIVAITPFSLPSHTSHGEEYDGRESCCFETVVGRQRSQADQLASDHGADSNKSVSFNRTGTLSPDKWPLPLPVIPQSWHESQRIVSREIPPRIKRHTTMDR